MCGEYSASMCFTHHSKNHTDDDVVVMYEASICVQQWALKCHLISDNEQLHIDTNSYLWLEGALVLKKAKTCVVNFEYLHMI